MTLLDFRHGVIARQAMEMCRGVVVDVTKIANQWPVLSCYNVLAAVKNCLQPTLFTSAWAQPGNLASQWVPKILDDKT